MPRELTQGERHDLDNRFNHHPPPSSDVAATYEANRRTLREATKETLQRIPYPSREASVFITKMEEAMFWANAAVAREPGTRTPAP